MRISPHSLAFLIALGAITVLAAGLTSTRVIGQTVASDSSEKSGAPAAQPAPKTPWGAPDLQGAWSNTTVVPFERPKEFGNREFKTDAEYKKAQHDLLGRESCPAGTAEKSTGRTSAARKKTSLAHTTSIGSATSPRK